MVLDSWRCIMPSICCRVYLLVLRGTESMLQRFKVYCYASKIGSQQGEPHGSLPPINYILAALLLTIETPPIRRRKL